MPPNDESQRHSVDYTVGVLTGRINALETRTGGIETWLGTINTKLDKVIGKFEAEAGAKAGAGWAVKVLVGAVGVIGSIAGGAATVYHFFGGSRG